MNRFFLSVAALLLAIQGFAQTDSTNKQGSDTIHVGNFIIVQKNGGHHGNYDSSYNNDNHHYTVDVNLFRNRNHVRNHNVITTDWAIFDLGFANWVDNTAYGTPAVNNFLHAGTGAPFTKEDLKLVTTKSSNVDIWLFMQKLNMIKHVLNLKYGLGYNMYNFRYENSITYNKNPVYLYRDDVVFTKDKLYAGYLTVPLMLNINTTPNKRSGFSFSAGISAGYLTGSHTKQKSHARGKQKDDADFDLNPWNLAYVAELGIGPVRLYGSYSLHALQQDAVVQIPYTIGIRFSSW